MVWFCFYGFRSTSWPRDGVLYRQRVLFTSCWTRPGHGLSWGKSYTLTRCRSNKYLQKNILMLVQPAGSSLCAGFSFKNATGVRGKCWSQKVAWIWTWVFFALLLYIVVVLFSSHMFLLIIGAEWQLKKDVFAFSKAVSFIAVFEHIFAINLCCVFAVIIILSPSLVHPPSPPYSMAVTWLEWQTWMSLSSCTSTW